MALCQNHQEFTEENLHCQGKDLPLDKVQQGAEVVEIDLRMMLGTSHDYQTEGLGVTDLLSREKVGCRTARSNSTCDKVRCHTRKWDLLWVLTSL